MSFSPLTNDQQKILKELLDECNDFRLSYIQLLRDQDKTFTTANRKFSAELVDYKLLPTVTSKENSYELVKLFQSKKYRYLPQQRYLLEEILALVKNNYINTEFKIRSVKMKGEYQLDKFVRLPFFGWIDPGFKIRKLKDVYFIVSENGIQIVSKAFCKIASDSENEKLEMKYQEMKGNRVEG